MQKAETFVYRAVEDGLIEIDSRGRVWKIARQQTSRWGQPTKIVSCKRKRAEHKGRYLQVRVMYDGVRYMVGAHRLVWFHFNGAIPGRLTINHKDGNEHNNAISNLELADYREQAIHAMTVLGWEPFKKGRFAGGIPGERNGQAKITARVAKTIKKSKDKGVDLARRFGLRTSTISRIRSGQLWGHVQ